MLDNLKKRFIAINLSCIMFVLIITFIIIGYTTKNNLYKTSLETLNSHLDMEISKSRKPEYRMSYPKKESDSFLPKIPSKPQPPEKKNPDHSVFSSNEYRMIVLTLQLASNGAIINFFHQSFSCQLVP